ncbi:MAG TPA: sulfite exporter TauE/SafE family protein [Candidatus Binataceae bacterium]|nr:sulfite exporter TauE/SafE family protein [Candidatus Binataceae bacterium]
MHTLFFSLRPVTLTLMFMISLVAGIGITTVGPGGVLMTIALYAMTGMTPALVAGTSIATHIATAIVGTLAYLKTGHLRDSLTRRLALILGASALVGTPAGVFINGQVSHRGFGILLGLLAAALAVAVWRRQRQASSDDRAVSGATAAAIGLTVALIAGLLGLGGPMLTVPLLVAAHTPILMAVAAAQAQALAISSVGTIGYGTSRAIDWPLALFVGVPEIAGVMLGAKIAIHVPAARLRYALAVVLLALAPYLAFHSG